MIMLPVEIKAEGEYCGDGCVGLETDEGDCRFFPEPLKANLLGLLRHPLCIERAQ